MAMNTPQEVVDQGVLVFKRVEDELSAVMVDILKLKPVFNKANELLMAGTGTNETRRINAKIDVAYGYVARALLAIAELHKDGTAIASHSGVDLVQADGGPGR